MAVTISPDDPRIMLLQQYCLGALKLKQDKWSKLTGTDESLALIANFLEKPEGRLLVISLNPSGVLVPLTSFPPTNKNKAVYYIKKVPEQLKKETMAAHLLVGDMSLIPLEQLSSFIESVLLPLLSNGGNHSKWPLVVSGDVLQHVCRLKGDVYVLSGQVKGKTLLPLPQQTESIVQAAIDQQMGRPFDKNLVHMVESVVIDWSHQIRDVLKRHSAEPLLEGLNPGPLVEVAFWRDRCDNLESIVDQLYQDKARKMSHLLEKALSSYYPALQNMTKDIVDALDEARDIFIFLKPLQKHFDDMEESDFVELPKCLVPLFHLICLVWVNCKHYQQPSRLIVLMQEISNLMMELAHGFVTDEVLRLEPQEGLEKVQDALKVCTRYKTIYHESKMSLPTYFKDGQSNILWEFQPSLIFARFDQFLAQLKIVEDYFHIVMEFLKLEKIEFGGIRGQSLSELVQQMFTNFTTMMTQLTEKNSDPLDPLNKDFTNSYTDFKSKVADMELRLGNIFCQAFDECSSYKSAFKASVFTM